MSTPCLWLRLTPTPTTTHSAAAILAAPIGLLFTVNIVICELTMRSACRLSSHAALAVSNYRRSRRAVCSVAASSMCAVGPQIQTATSERPVKQATQTADLSVQMRQCMHPGSRQTLHLFTQRRPTEPGVTSAHVTRNHCLFPITHTHTHIYIYT